MALKQFCIAGRNDGRLYQAVKNNDYRIVLNELRQGDIDPDLSIHNKTMLHHAGELGFKEIALVLIKFGANVDQTYGKQQRSMLHFAAVTENYGFASVLLTAKAIPSPRSSSGATPLHIAARTGQDYFTRLLLEFGADINAQDRNGKTPLHWGMQNGHVHTAKLLVDARADRNIPDKHAVTPKMVAERLALEL
jgi:ankyrin repeat protein